MSFTDSAPSMRIIDETFAMADDRSLRAFDGFFYFAAIIPLDSISALLSIFFLSALFFPSFSFLILSYYTLVCYIANKYY